jgi:hypothetical protein
MSTTRTIAAKYPGTCACRARFAAGARVNWIKGAGVTSCPACLPTSTIEIIDGLHVEIWRRAEAVVRVAVLGGSSEVAPGWLVFGPDCAPLIGGSNSMHNFDLWHDFGPKARAIAERVMAA